MAKYNRWEGVEVFKTSIRMPVALKENIEEEAKKKPKRSLNQVMVDRLERGR